MKATCGARFWTRHARRISLVSSFVVSLFAGEYAGIDSSDAGGMNLMDIHSRRWDANQLAISSHDVTFDPRTFHHSFRTESPKRPCCGFDLSRQAQGSCRETLNSRRRVLLLDTGATCEASR
jgi:hypothetical protein